VAPGLAAPALAPAVALAMVLALALAPRARAGPPYATDDPQPTPAGHYEVFFFTAGAHALDGHSGVAGIDFNYGAAPDLQLTAVLPVEWEDRTGAASARGIAGIELAAKYRFLHQADAGLDVGLFPRLILPAVSHSVGARRAALLLPLWLQRSGEDWAVFGGGGCELHRGGDARDFCMAGLAVTRQLGPRLQLGVELHHDTADARGAQASTGLGCGAIYDLGERWHLLASIGPGIQNRATTDRTQWYAAVLLTL
jgi:hypothetical protein